MQLICDHINKSFNEKKVLQDVSITFEKGKIYGLLGRNGAGKTTLFNCISKELPMDSGSCYLKDQDRVRQIDESDIGFVFSTPVLPDFLTGYEFIKFYMEANAAYIHDARSIDEYFDLVKIDETDRHRLIKEYSHGMKNKVQMLCFIIAKPLVVLLDEPLTSFDVVVALEMKNLLRQMRQEHILIFSTHVLQLATDLCDEIVILHNGSLQTLDEETMHSPNFEAEIVGILKDEPHA